MRPSRAAVGVVAALTLLGCGLGPSVGADRPRTPATAGATPNPGDADGTGTVEEFQDDINDARLIAERYWRSKLGDDFRPVRRLVAYDEAGEVTCGDQPLGLNNAAYCSAGDFIAYDVNWALAAFRQIGDAFLFYLLGHEYAHAVQVRLGVQAEFTIQQELQADCMAGAYLGDSSKPGAGLDLAEGDVDELRRGLAAVADDPGQPWFAEGSHGTVEQRTTAFADGYRDSLRPCGLT